MFAWQNLLNSARLSHIDNNETKSNETEISSFASDYKRIVTSPAFRRLQDKTQVFPLERNDFVHTRLTHSIEVAMIARELATNICQYIIEANFEPKITEKQRDDICRIVESASLLHDIGNPPFGHFGEYIIASWFQEKFSALLKDIPFEKAYLLDLQHFEGNAQALRLVTKLHEFSGNHGMDLTCATLNTMIKYTSCSNEPKDNNLVTHKKIGYFQSEKTIFNTITSTTQVGKNRHPLTFILEAADDIAYLTADIEDAIKKNVVSFQKFRDFLQEYNSKAVTNPTLNKYLLQTVMSEEENQNRFFLDIRTRLMSGAKFIFTSKYKEIMSGKYQYDLFKGSNGETLHQALKAFSYQYIFTDKNILKLEVSGWTILTFLLDQFIPAALYYKGLDDPSYQNDHKLHQKLIELISENHKRVYREFAQKAVSEQEKCYLRVLMVTDFISGMTDSYAYELYMTLSGNKIS
ncbi:deoxyguanosinetriphosphate triphosphohydrolase [Pasteurella oralis]|uniref:deoxyguanosinetriphosphate triphosphohydrolase n=1 Tax=Pasteurella oralis TaxID=1071947 RepID=UPI000C7B567E|nr:deoxyguanosinetriphosphate triphosphohydrolase [Pasteurella oralis]